MSGTDPIHHAEFLYQIYLAADTSHSGRVATPVLWDKQTGTIVNNESSEILRMFNSAFDAVGARPGDYCPADLGDEIDALNERVYACVNDGVYRCGFATSQLAYDAAVGPLFETLNFLEARLARQRYLCGERVTEADIRLLVTLLRFDAKRHYYESQRTLNPSGIVPAGPLLDFDAPHGRGALRAAAMAGANGVKGATESAAP